MGRSRDHNNGWPGQVLEDDRYHTERRAVDVTADALIVALRGIDSRERDRVELRHV